ncbi:DUF3306 domain-containing protein [Paucibacter sp. AS339]|uniref:DUF3306 domain-containing protein n=1 Tax=Paucibacter hankyongi TaxID=3133434 RepID=UPI0030B588BA
MAESNDEAPAGFLARWGRRKALARTGAPLPDAPPAAPVAPDPAPQAPAPAAAVTAPAVQSLQAQPAPVAEQPVLPTLADVATLNADSDYSRFMSAGVDRGVQRAAMKKLFFSDPHFNVMDGLDTYIDDYGKPDPIPLAVLRQMNQSKALRLFDAEDQVEEKTAASALTAPQSAQDLPPEQLDPPPSTRPPAIDTASPPDDHDPDLRLQQDDAAGRPGTEEGSGP